MKEISFDIKLGKKILSFSSETGGLVVNGKEYIALADGVLIYDKTKGIKADRITCQLSTNTSTLVPALRILGLSYNSYFDKREVVKSQNDITFYWEPSKLAAFYNRFSTDRIEPAKREPIVRKAVDFLIESAEKGENFLPVESLKKLKESCRLLGFYQGFPIFDGMKGMPKLLSRLGIHVSPDNIMVSTPLDKYADDVEELALLIEKRTGMKGIRKKNRVRFEKKEAILKELGVKS